MPLKGLRITMPSSLRHGASLLLVCLPLITSACQVWPGLTAVAAVKHEKAPSNLPLLLALLGGGIGGGHTTQPCLGQGYCWIFVTTGTWTPGGGLAGADAYCQSDAANYTALPVAAYRALLVTDNLTRDVDHNWVLHPNMPYYSASNSNLQITTTGENALIPALSNPISSTAGAVTWTGGGEDGVAAAMCANWASSLASDTGNIGYADDPSISMAFSSDFRTCDIPHMLYCVQQ